MLAKWKPIFEYIPIESQIEKFQNEYYETIARCHVEGESTHRVIGDVITDFDITFVVAIRCCIWNHGYTSCLLNCKSAHI